MERYVKELINKLEKHKLNDCSEEITNCINNAVSFIKKYHYDIPKEFRVAYDTEEISLYINGNNHYINITFPPKIGELTYYASTYEFNEEIQGRLEYSKHDNLQGTVLRYILVVILSSIEFSSIINDLDKRINNNDWNLDYTSF